MHGVQFIVCTHDVREWLHVLHGLNEIFVNVRSSDIYGLN